MQNSEILVLENKYYSFNEIIHLFAHKGKFQVSSEMLVNIQKSFNFLSRNTDKTIYGINTGFGPMVEIDIDEIEKAQESLIISHGIGTGRIIPPKFVKYILLSRLFVLAKGYSGVSLQLVDRILFFINNKIFLVVREHGGVGASGDLNQLAQIALGLIGKGFVFHKNKITRIKKLNPPNYEIQKRDCLAFINGTSAMTAIGIYVLYKTDYLFNLVLIFSSIILELFNSYDDYYSIELNSFKNQYGQKFVAEYLSKRLENSKLKSVRFENTFSNTRIQDIYSLRCITQILGPIFQTIENAKRVLTSEFNSISDNPIFDHINNKILFGGNFHGDYVSFEMDKLK